MTKVLLNDGAFVLLYNRRIALVSDSLYYITVMAEMLKDR